MGNKESFGGVLVKKGKVRVRGKVNLAVSRKQSIVEQNGIKISTLWVRSATVTIPDLIKSSTLVKSCVLGSSSVRDHRWTLKLHSSDGLAIFNSNMLIRLKFDFFFLFCIFRLVFAEEKVVSRAE